MAMSPTRKIFVGPRRLKMSTVAMHASTAASATSVVTGAIITIEPAIRGIRSPQTPHELETSPTAAVVLLQEDDNGKAIEEAVIAHDFPIAVLKMIGSRFGKLTKDKSRLEIAAGCADERVLCLILPWLLTLVNTLLNATHAPPLPSYVIQVPENSPFDHMFAYWRTFLAMGHAKWASQIERLMVQYVEATELDLADMRQILRFTYSKQSFTNTFLKATAVRLVDKDIEPLERHAIRELFRMERPDYLWSLTKLQAQTGDIKSIDELAKMKEERRRANGDEFHRWSI
ncbi:hypothetical protein BT63DRAFT_411111 [Microthyrium microscopicum]|uniref:Uncharacterized protein n=1 Tax=Microthyrium microscopicum TaxID=703497 RepID=A0A6A6UHU9_9PEZI|nr:hypothetical protein BT63DRAFT_411111 [Microthyrium microscopicum]